MTTRTYHFWPHLIRDSDIRSALIRELIKADPNGLVIPEMCVCRGRARIDISMINGNLHRFEIKSEVDTLDRLASQQDIYNKVFDLMTIVATENHMGSLIGTVPNWWGITGVVEEFDTIRLITLRRAQHNPSVDGEALAQLLWRDEAMDILHSHGIAGGLQTKGRQMICARLAESFDVKKLGELVRNKLMNRTDWRPAKQQT